jgi:DNA polymerase III gamma/tau subunit
MNAEVLAEKLANEHRPRFFKDFVTNDEFDLGSPANQLKNAVAKNYHSVLGNLTLLGKPGSGKSSLASIYSKAILCYNRLEGEYEPCGYCPVCLGEDKDNIHEYTLHQTSAAWEPIRELIERSRQLPVLRREGVRADQFYRIIILNEIEVASPELLNTLLDATEHAPKTTIWIFISMDEEKMIKKSETTAEAIISRTADLHLPSFSNTTIATTIAKKTDINYDAALAIAKLSKGNMRRAWSNVAMCRGIVDEDSEITEDLVLYSRSGGATKENRMEMWEALAKGDGTRVKELVNFWTEKSADIKLVGTLLQEDIIDNLHSPSQEVQSLLAALGRWYTGLSYPLTTVFMSHLGTKVIQFPTTAERELRKQVKEQTVVNVADIVSQQTIKAVSNTFKVPVLLAVSSYKELMLHYNESN